MQQLIVQIVSELRSAWRFRWYGAAAAWAICLSGWLWVAWQPSIYEASATVFVDTTSVLRPILNEQIVANDVTAQLTYVRQALLGREHLERVASDNGLDRLVTSAVEQEDLLSRLRNTIRINTSQASREDNNTIYSISYRNPDRERAVGVVSTLLNSLVEDTLGAGREGTDTAARFLDDRILEYENRLQRAEKALANFQRANADRLPGVAGSYFDQIQQQRNELQGVTRELRLAESGRDRLAAQLNSESPVIPTGLSINREPPPDSLDARIRDLRQQLDELLLDYTENHPDVRSTRTSLERLEGQRAEQLRAMGVTNTNQEISNLDTNPVYQALMDEVPEVEAELARLNRDYDVVYEQYQGLIRSRETQDLSRKASDTDQVDFRVINPPLASFEPVAPPRLRLLAVVFIAGVMAAAGICYLMAQIRPVFTSMKNLRDATGLPVLGVVNKVRGVGDLFWRRVVPVASYASCMGLLFAVFVAAVSYEMFGPGVETLLR